MVQHVETQRRCHVAEDGFGRGHLHPESLRFQSPNTIRPGLRIRQIGRHHPVFQHNAELFRQSRHGFEIIPDMRIVPIFRAYQVGNLY